MVFQDLILLVRKIIIGFIIFLVPLALIAGALWLVQNFILK